MGTCKYCGQSTVLFSRSHKECENKHDNALSEFEKVCTAFFAGHKSQADIVNYRNRLKTNSFLSDEDIVIIADKAIRYRLRQSRKKAGAGNDADYAEI